MTDKSQPADCAHQSSVITLYGHHHEHNNQHQLLDSIIFSYSSTAFLETVSKRGIKLEAAIAYKIQNLEDIIL